MRSAAKANFEIQNDNNNNNNNTATRMNHLNVMYCCVCVRS